MSHGELTVQQQPPTLWQPHCGSQTAAVWDTPQTPCWPSGNTEVPTQSQVLSVVARSIPTDWWHSEALPNLCTTVHTTQGATDLFHLEGVDYLLVVDYLSRYPKIVKLTKTSPGNIVVALRTIFARHGIPETVMSDNGPQYSSSKFAEFARTYLPCYKQSSLSSKQWPSRAYSPDSEEDCCRSWRPNDGYTSVLLNTTYLVWPISRWTPNGKTDSIQRPSGQISANTNMRWILMEKPRVQRETKGRLWSLPLCPCNLILQWTTLRCGLPPTANTLLVESVTPPNPTWWKCPQDRF